LEALAWRVKIMVRHEFDPRSRVIESWVERLGSAWRDDDPPKDASEPETIFIQFCRQFSGGNLDSRISGRLTVVYHHYG
jgi:hypothetical protein